MTKKLSTEEFIRKAAVVHKGVYEYTNTTYVNRRTKVEIICKEHGSFLQLPGNHVYKRAGCQKCARARSVAGAADAKRLSVALFIQDATETHSGKYDYTKVEFSRVTDRITILCPDHGTFTTTVYDHRAGLGCPMCSVLSRRNGKFRYYSDEPTILYYIKFSTIEGPLYKIGITIQRRGITKRFYGHGFPPFEILSEVVFSTGQRAYVEEQRLHLMHKAHRYLGPDILPNGNSELYTKDVLLLDR